MEYIRPTHVVIENFRNFKNVDFNLGRKITVISGQNGVGKSNLLSLIASSSGLSKRAALGSNFQPDFNDFFSIDTYEQYGEYEIYVDFSDTEGNHVLRKALTFKDDTNTNRGIRIIPRTRKLSQQDHRKVTEVEKDAKEKYGVGGAARVPIPTIYLSISRLYPLGERKDTVDIKKYRKDNKLYQKNADKKFIEWYNYVIPNSIHRDGSLYEIKKKTSSRASFHVDMIRTPAMSQSVGQDNLGNIISALVDIYLLSLENDYRGAIICIDEIDVSLHPDSQINLLDLLEKLSEELSIQFILTTHSLTMIEQMSRMKEKKPSDYKIVYLINPSQPFVSRSDNIYSIKADLFNKMSYSMPKVKVYLEDQMGKLLFLMLLDALETQINQLETSDLRDYSNEQEVSDLNKRLLALRNIVGIDKKLLLMPVEIGCEEIIRINDIDKYFKRVIMILDGDARIKNGEGVEKPEVRDFLTKRYSDTSRDRKHEFNVLYFPGYFAPESFMYKIIYNLVHEEEKHRMFWRSIDQFQNTHIYTANKLRTALEIENEKYTNCDIKKLFQGGELKKFATDTSILNYYYGSYETVEPLLRFWEEFAEIYKAAESNTLKDRFS
ncbi:MAG: AAA family ATPase [Eubacteriales bacterium]|nr:AAA family ATPase [Eubacteriales bacterium]